MKTKYPKKKVRNYLRKFTETSAYDSGVRDIQAEAYLKGLEKAQRFVKGNLVEKLNPNT